MSTGRSSLSSARLIAMTVGIAALVVTIAGSSASFVTTGRFGLDTSASLDQLVDGASAWITFAAVLGIIALLLAQAPYGRWLAVLPLLVGAGTACASLYEMDRINSGNALRDLLNSVADTRPANGFWLLITGGAVASVASLVILLVPRTASAPVRVAALTQAPTAATPSVTLRVPLPDRRPGWHPDPAGTGLLRWWDGNRWADAPMSAQPLPAPHMHV